MKKILSFALALALCAGLSAPAFAAEGTAYASTQSVEVDGKKVEFQMYALRDANGNGTNYVKLRDVAHVLNGTPAQFSVGYNSASGSILVTTGAAYADTGTEMTTPYSGDRTCQTGSGAVLVDGRAASLDAIVLTDDAGGGYTYFKLRDLGSALGFTVDWSAQRGVTVSTGGEPSVPEKPSVEDNTPKLANGKDITEANVLELLAEVEKKYPTGTKWNDSYDTDNHYNTNSISKPVLDTLYTYNIGAKYACGGFAAMVSDLVFGYDNPCRKLDDISEIRPGDIIIQFKGTTPVHVMIAADNSFVKNGFTGVHKADGNNNNQVMWPSTSDSNNLWLSPSASTFVVYTRYPE